MAGLVVEHALVDRLGLDVHLLDLFIGGDGAVAVDDGLGSHGRVGREQGIQQAGDDRSQGESSVENNVGRVDQREDKGVGARVVEHVSEDSRDDRGAGTEGKGSRNNETLTAGPGEEGQDADSRDNDAGEEESSHASEDCVGNHEEEGSELGEDTHEDQEEAAHVTGHGVGAAGQGDDSIVLGVAGHGRVHEERGQHASNTVGEDTALETRLELTTLNGQLGNLAGSGDVTNGLDHGQGVRD